MASEAPAAASTPDLHHDDQVEQMRIGLLEALYAIDIATERLNGAGDDIGVTLLNHHRTAVLRGIDAATAVGINARTKALHPVG